MADIEVPSGEDFEIKLGSKSASDVVKITDSDGTTLLSVAGDGSAVLPITGYVQNSTFDANTILKADTDNTPEALSVAEQTVVGRLTGGEIDDIAIGLLNDNMVQVDGTAGDPNDDEFARWTAYGLEGRTVSETRSDLSVPSISGTPAQYEYARWAGVNSIEGRDSSEAKTDLGFMTDLSDDTTPSLSGNLAVGENLIVLDQSLSATNKYSGTGLGDVGTTGSPATYDLLYLNTSSNFAPAKADSSTTMHCVGLYLGSSTVLLHGFVRNTGWSFTAGQKLYVSASTSGGIVTTAPSSTGQIVQCIGWAYSSDTIYFWPSLDTLVVA